MGPYILDFFCYPMRLAIELDGEIHATDTAKEHDAERDRYLASCKIKIIRFANREVFENIDWVLEIIKANLGPPP